MKINTQNLLVALGVLTFLLIFNSPFSTVHAQGTAFTYQGRFSDGGVSANGSYDLVFTLFANNISGVGIAGPVTNSAVSVTNGLFTTLVDFGNAFTGTSNWLEIAVSTNGANAFSTLAPRQQLTPVPYAIYGETAGTAGVANSVAGGSVSSAQLNTLAPPTSGQVLAFNGSSLAWTNPANASPAWNLTGNSGTTAGANFLGTTDNQPLELRVNSQRALRLELNSPDGPNVIGGYSNNFVASGLSSATIAGGGLGGFTNRITGSGYGGAIGGGRNNWVNNFNGVVGGGANNTAFENATTIGGGSENYAGSDHDTIAGGQYNFTSGDHAAIGGGVNNSNESYTATISGGENNLISGVADHATIGGGGGNIIIGSDALPVYGTIGGGAGNLIETNTSYASISGGVSNTDFGSFATIPGGDLNAATNNSFAAGHRAKAINSGAFVWADSQNADFSSTTDNQFNVRAGGGVRLVTGGAGLTLDGQPVLTPASGAVGLAIQQNTNGAPNIIEGAQYNSVSSGVVGATIGGGGAASYSGGPLINTVTADFGTVSGGANNSASGQYAVVGGGVYNAAGGNSSTVGGGYNNSASGSYSVVAGGDHNTASGDLSVVCGGEGNVAGGQYSFAGGYGARANYVGDFVWADSQLGAFSATANNQFWVRAAGGVNLQAAAGVVMNVSGSSGLNPAALLVNSTSANGVGLYVVETSSDASFVVNNAGTGDIVKGFNGGGSPVFEVVHDGTVYSKGIALTSDRHAKENFTAVNAQSVLAKVSALPIAEWNYKTDSQGVQHLGPMAQDFHAAFGLNGSDDKHISVVDESGVALAAIQGLNQKIEEQKAENAELKEQLAELKALVNKFVANQQPEEAK